MSGIALNPGVLTAAIALVLYALTLAPGLTWANFGGDGGELIAAAYTYGTPHPPGYPLFVLIGKLVSIVPIGTVAWRFNLFNAICFAATAGMLSAAVFNKKDEPERSILRSPSAYAVSVGLAFAFTPLVWQQALITEVYGLNLVLAAMYLLALRRRVPSAVSGVLLGLAVAAHPTSLLLIPFGLLQQKIDTFANFVNGIAAGLLPLILIPLQAASRSPVQWGNVDTVGEWWWLVSGQLYRSNLMGVEAAEFWRRVLNWPTHVWGSHWWLVLPLLLAAAVLALRKPNNWRQGLLMTTGFYYITACGYAAVDAIVFLLPGIMTLLLLAGDGLRSIGSAAVLLPLLLISNLAAVDLSSDTAVQTRAVSVMESAPDNAVLLTPGDVTIFALWYVQTVEGLREDVTLVDANLLAFDWYRQRLSKDRPDLAGLEIDDVAEFRRLNAQRKPICQVRIDPAAPVAAHLLNCEGNLN